MADVVKNTSADRAGAPTAEDRGELLESLPVGACGIKLEDHDLRFVQDD